MNLVELSEADKEKYNQFVAANDSGSFLQSWEWGQWQSALGREAKRFFYKDTSSAGGNRLGALQVIKMPLPLGRYYWYAPYGPMARNQLTILDEVFLRELGKKLQGAVFIRLEPKRTIIRDSPDCPLIKSANIQPAKTLVVNLGHEEKYLLEQMHPKTRYNIRVAEKHGVEVQDEFVITVGKGIYAQEAVELIAETAARQKYKSQGKAYFKKMADFFAVQNNKGSLRLHIYKALHEKQLLASAFMLDFGNTRTYLFGGSSAEKRNVMAVYALHWRAMLDAKHLGLKFYDFWGVETAGGEAPGFVRFKMGFDEAGAGLAQYYGARDLILRPLEYKLYKVFRFLNRLMKV